MSNDWIKLRKKLLNDPRTVGIAARLDTTEPHILGCLAALWFTADSHADPATGFLEHYSAAKLDQLVCLTGFCAAVVDVTKRHPDGPWLIVRDNGVTFPEYGTHNGGTAKRRASEARRRASARSDCGQMSATDADKCPQPMRTKSGLEKEKEKEKEKDELQLPASANADVTGVTTRRRAVKVVVNPATAAIPPDLMLYEPSIREFATWRAESLRKPILAGSWGRFMGECRKFGATLPAVVAQSIANGWQGLFALKSDPGATSRVFAGSQTDQEVAKYGGR